MWQRVYKMSMQETIKFFHAIDDVVCEWGKCNFSDFDTVLENVSKKHDINKDELNNKLKRISLCN